MGDLIQVKYHLPKGISSKRGRVTTGFNPSSINLYDEELVEIIDSDGLIGISLNKRIIGATTVREEIFSAGD